MKIIIIFLLICSASFSAVHIGPGQIYTNIQSAFINGTVHAGDTVYLHEGNYTGYQGIQFLKGNQSAWIVITPFNDDKISISGNWQFQGCEYIKFLNLTFRATTTEPGRLINVDNNGSCTTQSRFIRFDSCHFSNVTDANAITAFKFGGVDYFEVTNCTFKDMPVCNAFDFNVCHNGLIRGNRIENCLSGGHIKGGASFITMERNLFLNASKPYWVAFELGGDTGEQFYCPDDKFEVRNLNFYSNIVVGGYRGIALSSAKSCNVVNNTFYNCGQATLRFLTTSSLYPELDGNMIYNNIFAFGSSAYINGSTQPQNAAYFRDNLYYSIKDSVFNGPYWDTPDLDKIKDKNPKIYGSTTKMFVDAENNDFHLVEGSPAIGAGDMIEPTFDFYGNKFTSPRTLGAVAYIPPVSVADLNQNKLLIYPNPATDYISIDNLNINSISIYNTYGVKLEVKSIDQFNTFDISSLSPGIYLIKGLLFPAKFIKL